MPRSLVLTLLLGLAARSSEAQLKELQTPDLRLVYIGATESYLAPHVARTFHNSLAFQRRIFDWTPSEKTTVLLTDFSDSGNAGATAVPRNYVTVQMAPLSFAFETLAANERMNTIMNHEMVHVAMMDGASARDRGFRRLFGGKVQPVADQPESILYMYLTSPRVAAPRWYLEGSAVFVDTWMAGGIGRAQSPYDEMVFRSMVRDGSRFYDPLGLVSEGTKIDFQLQINSYLYGTRFMSFLALTRSPEAVVRWLSRGAGTRAYYSSQFRQVFGLPLEKAWAEWIAWERSFQDGNLAAVRQFPATPTTDVSPRALGSVSRPHYDPVRKKVYAAFNYPGITAHVGSIGLEDGKVDKIADIKGPSIYTVTSTAYDAGSGTLFYTTDNNAYRDLMALDVTTGRPRMLQKDLRVGDLALNRADRSLWGVRHFNGICTLVRIPPPYKEWNRVRSWPYGEVIYDLDVSPDGTQVSMSVGEVSGRNTLRVYAVEALQAAGDEPRPVAELDFSPAIPSNFVFSADGRYLYGTSFYTGVSNVFRFEVAAQAREAVSNTETGLFRPLPLGEGRLFAFRYSGEGFVPVTFDARPLQDVSAITLLGQQVAEKHPVVADWKLGSPAAVPLDTLAGPSGTYSSRSRLRVESFYPVVQGYKDTAGPGFRLNFSDPIQLHRGYVSASFTPGGGLEGSERLHAREEYTALNWTFRARYNPADFYDLFGPTKTGRKGHSVGLAWEKTLVFDLPRQGDLMVSGDSWGG
ncbi:MAG TPA: hypothetical protein VFM29_01605, partial [Vicinamibacteria bacterium]|nr:hypothetical protein [Vicinamibacteria bacterium]